MPPQRRPLAPISGNRLHNHELSPYERGRIIGAKIAGMTPRQIELTMKHSRGAVRGTIALEILRTNGNSLPRPGRPKLYHPRDQRAMLRNIRSYPKLTFQQRREDTGLTMSNTYIKKIASENGLHHWRAKKRPELTAKVAALRLAWCLARKDWTVEQWKKIMWSDECSAERGKGKKRSWIWGTPHDKWKPEFVETYKKGKDLRVMVWAMFWGNGERSELYVLDRDFESKKEGYSANSYIKVLDAMLLRHYCEDLYFI